MGDCSRSCSTFVQIPSWAVFGSPCMAMAAYRRPIYPGIAATQSEVDALTIAGFVVVHRVRESNRVKPRPPPSRLPPVDRVNWLIPECKTPTWRGERKCGRRKGIVENIDKRNKGLALLAWVLDIRPTADGPGLQYRIEFIESVGTNLPEEYTVTISCYPTCICLAFVDAAAKPSHRWFLACKHLCYVYMTQLNVQRDDPLMFQLIHSRTVVRALIRNDPKLA
jgi:hypothetical protein